MGLRLKIILPLLLFCLISVGYFWLVWFPLYIEEEKLHDQERLTSHLSTFSISLVSPLLESDLSQVYLLLDGMKLKYPEWKSLKLINANGISLYPLTEEKINITKKQYHTLSVPVVINDKSIASLHLLYDYTEWYKHIEADLYKFLYVLLAGLALLVFVSGIALDIIIRKPLRKLADAASKIRQG